MLQVTIIQKQRTELANKTAAYPLHHDAVYRAETCSLIRAAHQTVSSVHMHGHHAVCLCCSQALLPLYLLLQSFSNAILGSRAEMQHCIASSGEVPEPLLTHDLSQSRL